jgi:hypothetical protein
MPDYEPEFDENGELIQEPNFSEDAQGGSEEVRGLSPDEILQTFEKNVFKDGTPDYVNKTPTQSGAIAGEVPPVVAPPVLDPNHVVGPNSPVPTQRLSAEQIAGRVPPVPSSVIQPGQQVAKKTGGFFSRAKNVADGIDGTGAALAVTEIAGGVIGGEKGKKVAEAASLASSAARASASEGLDIIADVKLKLESEKKKWKYLVGLAAVELLFVIMVGLVFSGASRKIGNVGGSLGIGSGSFAGTGQYLTIMTDHLTYNQKGKSITLTLNATQGGYTAEDPATENSSSPYIAGNPKDLLRAQQIYDPVTGQKTNWTQPQLDYYVTMRWPYAKYYWAPCGKQGGAKVSQPETVAQNYFGRKIVIYNPKTNKAVIGMAGEEGPGVWTGIFAHCASSKGPAVGRLLPGGQDRVDVAAQEQAWKIGPNGQEPRNDVPAGYQGRIVGGSNVIGNYLFPDDTDKKTPGDDQIVTVGFLDPKFDSLPLGPVDASKIQVINGGTNTPFQTASSSSLVSCIALARNKNISFSHTNDYAGFLFGQIVRVKGASGYPAGSLVPLDTKMCALMQTFEASHPTVKINFNSVVGTHPIVTGNNSRQSRHSTGHGMDLNVDLAGILMPWIIQNITQLTAAGIMPHQVIGPNHSDFDGKDYTSYAVNGGVQSKGFFVAGHNNHVHIGF